MKKPSKVMRRTFLLLVCALALFSVKQTCGQIVRGRVVDQERQPVVGVAVVMLDTDSTYLAAAASDADGRFAIASEVRPYRLLFQHLAYEMQTLTSEHDEAGEVVLHEYTNALDAVVVEGEKPIVRVEEGRLAYDLEAVSKGKAVNNAYEALTQLPGVSEQDGRADACRRRGCHGDPEREALDDERRAVGVAAALDTRRTDREGRSDVQHAAAVPCARRGDQPRPAAQPRLLVFGGGTRQLYQPVLQQLGCRGQLRLLLARVVGRGNLFGRAGQDQTDHRPLLAAYARGRGA